MGFSKIIYYHETFCRCIVRAWALSHAFYIEMNACDGSSHSESKTGPGNRKYLNLDGNVILSSKIFHVFWSGNYIAFPFRPI